MKASKRIRDSEVMVVTESKAVMESLHLFSEDLTLMDQVLLMERPYFLSQDPYQLKDVVLYVLSQSDSGKYTDLILVQSVCPLLEADDIVNAHTIYRMTGKSVRSIVRGSRNYWYMANEQMGLIPVNFVKQAISSAMTLYASAGAFIIASVGQFLEEKTFFLEGQVGYVLPEERAVDIDTQLDFDCAEFLMRRKAH
jgi:CMP-N-acetylneuraminic acid synthetase